MTSLKLLNYSFVLFSTKTSYKKKKKKTVWLKFIYLSIKRYLFLLAKHHNCGDLESSQPKNKNKISKLYIGGVFG